MCLAGQLHRAEAQRTAGISQALALKQDINKLQQKLAAAQQRTVSDPRCPLPILPSHLVPPPEGSRAV